jgi:hypothetical protein
MFLVNPLYYRTIVHRKPELIKLVALQLCCRNMILNAYICVCVCGVCVNKIAEKTPQKNTLKAIVLSVPAQPKLM